MIEPSTIRRIFERGRTPLIVAVVGVTVASIALATNLTISPELQDLLPQSSEAVESLERFKEKYRPDLNSVALLVQGPNPEHNRRAAEEIARWLRDRDDVEFAEARRPAEFFQDHRLLYLERSRLAELADRVEDRVQWEKKKANPLYVPVEDEPPELRRDEWARSLEGLPDSVHFKDDSGEHYVVFAEVEFPTLRVSRTERFRRELTERFDRQIASRWSEVELSFSGRHFKQRQQRRALRSRLARATLVAVVAVILFLAFYFRDWLAPLLIGGPLALGTIWAFGWAELTVGRLSVLAASLATILIGLGVDYGIHLLVRYRTERRTQSHRDSLAGMVRKAGPPCFFAAATTALAFGVLGSSSLRAFVEFGVVGAGGVLLILLAFVVVLPLALDLRGEADREEAGTGEGGRPMAEAVRARVASWTTDRRVRWIAGASLGLLVALAAAGGPRIAFNDSFRAVFETDLPAFRTEAEIQEAVGVRQQPAFLPAEDLEHAAELVEIIRRRRRTRPNGDLIGRIVSPSECIPSDQDEKIRILEDLRATLDELPDGAVDDSKELERFVGSVDAALGVAPVEERDLPDRIQRRFFRDADGDPAALIAVLPSRPIYSASTSETYIDLLSGLPDGDGGESLRAIAYERIMPATIDYIRADGWRLLGLLFVGLLSLAFVAARDLREWVETVGTLGLALGITAGLCGLVGLEFDLFNVVAWPIWFGLGLDALFHLNRHPPPADRLDREALEDFLATLGATSAAFATTMLGFGVLAFSGHPGLESLGRVTLVGLATIWTVSVLAKIALRRENP